MSLVWKKPKYNYGLLETPATTSNDNVSTLRTTSASISNRASTNVHSRFSFNRSSSTPYQPRSARTPATGVRSSRRTPGSRYSLGATPARESSSTIVAVVEGRGLAKGEVGLASVDLRQPVIQLSQFSDCLSYAKLMTKLNILQPIEVVMPNTACEMGSAAKLVELINEEFDGCNMVTLHRRYFSETTGLQYIQQLCLADYRTVEMEVRNKYYCLASLAALLKYVEFIQLMVFLPASVKIVFRGSEQTAMIDMATTRHLELLSSNRNVRDQAHSLFGVLNYTKTRMGSRLLRSSLLQPPADVQTITMRQEVVGELLDNEAMFFALQRTLASFPDMEHMLAACVQALRQELVTLTDTRLSAILSLKLTVQLVKQLATALANSHSALLHTFLTAMTDANFDVLLSKIEAVVSAEFNTQKGALTMQLQKCFLIKPGVNALHDIARRAYTELVNDFNLEVKKHSEQYNLALRVGYSALRGFHVQLYCGTGASKVKASDLPSVFIKVTKFKNTFSFTTVDLVKMNDRIKESLSEIYLTTNVVVMDLLTELRPLLGCLYKVSDCVALLDLLVAFAHNCTVSNYVRPEFTATLAVKQGRHPILDKISAQQPVSNNVFASEASNFVVITGPNMSGKSTYLRQIALLQIMAQMGSYVPAAYASFHLVTQIFSRMGSDDDIETNTSTFTREMKDMNYIIQNVSKDSLLIIDELGRGTSVDEGTGICVALCETLMRHQVFTFIATHFLEVADLDTLYPNAENYHFEVNQLPMEDSSSASVIFTHHVSKGKTTHMHYGIQLAESTALPRQLVSEARSIAETLDCQALRVRPSAEEVKERATYRLGMKLAQVALHSSLDDASLQHYFTVLAQEYTKALAQHQD